MTTTIEVNVTAEDIERGEQQSCNRCPVALALLRWLRPGLDVEIVTQARILDTGGAVHDFILPVEADEFIEQFDSNDGGAPFSFPLTLPGELLKPELRSMTIPAKESHTP